MIDNPTRVAFAGDWHMNTRWALSCVDHLSTQDVDVILHTGDFGYTFDDDFIVPLNEALIKAGIELYFVDGNHEDHDYLEMISEKPDDDGTAPVFRNNDKCNIHYLPRGFTWQWWGKTFLGLGGAVSVDQRSRRHGKSWWPQEELTYKEVYDIIDRLPEASVDVVLSHDVSDRVIWPGHDKGRQYFPSDLIDRSEAHARMVGAVIDWVAPSLHVHGHMHTRYSQVRENSNRALNKTLVTGLAEDGSEALDNLLIMDREMFEVIEATMAADDAVVAGEDEKA